MQLAGDPDPRPCTAWFGRARSHNFLQQENASLKLTHLLRSPFGAMLTRPESLGCHPLTAY